VARFFFGEVAFKVAIPDTLGGGHVSGQYKPDQYQKRTEALRGRTSVLLQFAVEAALNIGS